MDRDLFLKVEVVFEEVLVEVFEEALMVVLQEVVVGLVVMITDLITNLHLLLALQYLELSLSKILLMAGIFQNNFASLIDQSFFFFFQILKLEKGLFQFQNIITILIQKMKS